MQTLPIVLTGKRACACSSFAMLLFVGWLPPQQHASVSQGRICLDKCSCCHTEIEVAGQTFCLTQSQYTDTGSTSPSTDPITPRAWQGSHSSASFQVSGLTRPGKIPAKVKIEFSNPGSAALEADALTTGPTRQWKSGKVSASKVTKKRSNSAFSSPVTSVT